MKIEEGLTKENFWNEIEQKFPNAFKIFADWIDEYKKEINWDELFPIKIEYENIPIDFILGQKVNAVQEIGKKQIKFHDLPHAMQLGIWLSFTKNEGNYPVTIIEEDFDLKVSIYFWMVCIEDKIG